MLKRILNPQTIMLTVWWCIGGVIHRSFFKSGETIMQWNTTPCLIQCIKHYQLCALDWSKEMKFQCFVTTRDLTFPDQFRKITHLRLWNSFLLSILPRPSANRLPLFKNIWSLLGMKMFSNVTTVKNAFEEFLWPRMSTSV